MDYQAILEERGFESREEYLRDLADTYEVSYEDVVQPLAALLGPEEDFDGLVSSVADAAGSLIL